MTDLIRVEPESQPDDLAIELRQIAEESASLTALGCQLGKRIDAALARIDVALALLEPAPAPSPETVPARVLREFGLEYLATASSKQLRQDLVTARGSQAASVFRTKLNAELEAERGRRHPNGGSARVGNGEARV